MKPLIYVTRKIPENLLQPYSHQFSFRMWEKEDVPVPRSVLLEEIAKADGLLSLITERIDKGCLEKAPNLKIVANMAVGFDNVDIKTAQNSGVIVTNTPDVLTETTADLTFALLMAASRKIVAAAAYVKEDKWQNWSPFQFAGTDVHHKTIGIAGMGRIGQAVAKRAKGFGMTVIYHNRSRHIDAEKSLHAEYTSLDTLLEKSDFVVSLVPYTKETNQMFNKHTFEKMKNTALFINVSRGQVVNEDDLYDALCKGKIAGAGLDVFANEPVRQDHPLLTLDTAVCLPHMGSASMETRAGMIDLCLQNISCVFAGEKPLTPVTS